jgi:hypothetical protein
MTVSKSVKLGRYVRAAAIFMSLTCAGAVRAQAPPYALFQYSSLTGSGNTITATEVPVVTASGVTVYVNLALQFNVDANGNLTISTGYPQVTPAPTILTSSFTAGTYVGPSTALAGGMIVTVSGPGVTDGGATEWTLSTGSGANNCTTPVSASWYVGPIASNPWASRIKAAGITSTAFSYGIASGPGCGFTGVTGNDWPNGALIGVSQVGNTLTIASFSSGSTDNSLPVNQITYTLKQ